MWILFGCFLKFIQPFHVYGEGSEVIPPPFLDVLGRRVELPCGRFFGVCPFSLFLVVVVTVVWFFLIGGVPRFCILFFLGPSPVMSLANFLPKLLQSGAGFGVVAGGVVWLCVLELWGVGGIVVVLWLWVSP